MYRSRNDITQTIESVATREADELFNKQMYQYWMQKADYPDYNRIWLDIYYQLQKEYLEDK